MENNIQFKKYQPLSLRIWHWGSALVVIGLLLTVLLRKTFLSWRANAKLIEERVVEAGGAVSTEAAQAIAKELRNIMWEWHNYLGFALGALLLFRIVLAIRSKKVSLLKLLKEHKGSMQAKYFVAVRSLYAVFYVATTFMVVSGLMMYFEKDLGLSKDLKGFLKENHELAMWFFVGFVAVHILGVVAAEARKATRGIVSDMINGGDKN
jgi:cytochrome b561